MRLVLFSPMTLELGLRSEQFITISAVEGHDWFDLRRRPSLQFWFSQRPGGFIDVRFQSVFLQFRRGLELCLTEVTLVNVNMALLHVYLSLHKVFKTLPTKVTSLAAGHFWSKLTERSVATEHQG